MRAGWRTIGGDLHEQGVALVKVDAQTDHREPEGLWVVEGELGLCREDEVHEVCGCGW